MITEDYVSFETAKLLKEKGFPQNPNICNTAYTPSGKLSNNAKSFAHNFTEFDKLGIKPMSYSMAPTLQMAMKWLREVHHFHIIPEISDGSCLNPQYYVVIWLTTSKRESYILELFDSYEEACEEAIKYCLENLI